MRITDVFCGLGAFWTPDPLMPLTPAAVLEVMDSCGIEKALVHSNLVGTPAWTGDANALVAEAAREDPRFEPVFILSTHGPDGLTTPADYAAQMKAAGCRLAYLRPTSVWYGLCTWALEDLLGMCSDARLPVLLSVLNQRIDEVEQVCRHFPKLRVVLANVDYSNDTWLYPLLRRHKQVSVVVGPTYIPPMGPWRFVKHFGVQRLIYGSGLPQFAPGGALAMVMYADLRDQDKQSILSANIESLMAEAAL
jgi:predicted TIM-barrel fold metal-dependent hydrolase